MSTVPHLQNCVRTYRLARGWSQETLAVRAGLSRAGVSAIEMGRLVPSAAAALALAATFGCRVEDLFQLDREGNGPDVAWAWPPAQVPCRYWLARVGARRLRYPVEAGGTAGPAHDGTFDGATLRESPAAPDDRTLVLASCDPAAGLLAAELERRGGVRLVVLPRSSRQALELLREGLVHVAGVHLAALDDDSGNAAVVRQELGADYLLLRAAEWDEGLAVAPASRVRSPSAALRAALRWVGREPGSGARQCLDELRPGGRPPRRLARDHRGVAEAIRCGWADIGVCLRLAGVEAGLDFFTIRREAYDLCLPRSFETDPRGQALIQALRTPTFRGLLADLPGYDATRTGEIQRLD